MSSSDCKYCGKPIFWVPKLDDYGGWHPPLTLVESGKFFVVTELGLTPVETLYVRHVCDPATTQEYRKRQMLARLVPLEAGAETAAYAENERREASLAEHARQRAEEEYRKTPAGWYSTQLAKQQRGRGALALELDCPHCGAVAPEPCTSTDPEPNSWRRPDGAPAYLNQPHRQRYPAKETA